MTDRLERMLNSDAESREKAEEKDGKERALFSKIYMPSDVYQKMLKYAKFANEKAGECYGYLIGSKNRLNKLVEDVYFPPGQTNTSAHTSISGRTVIKVGREMREKGKRILGWWHSHADINIFPSGTDDENFHTVLDQIAPTNYVIAYENVKFLKEDIKKTLDGDNKLIICDRSNSARRLEMFFSEIGENPLTGIPLKEIVVRLPKQISYAYSIIVNANGDKPYAGLLTKELCMSCRSNGKSEEPKILQLKVLKYKIGVNLNDAELRKEVNSKIIRERIRQPAYDYRDVGSVDYNTRGFSIIGSAIRRIKSAMGIEDDEQGKRDDKTSHGKEDKK